jgi:hypothetical protein
MKAAGELSPNCRKIVPFRGFVTAMYVATFDHHFRFISATAATKQMAIPLHNGGLLRGC